MPAPRFLFGRPGSDDGRNHEGWGLQIPGHDQRHCGSKRRPHNGAGRNLGLRNRSYSRGVPWGTTSACGGDSFWLQSKSSVSAPQHEAALRHSA